ncbi:Trm112 family protein [Pseudomarimonas arenosa]|uniref:Trm112 family protein n=1 Tax=Pseudomarimonas arenosa TaxID=2774145 RepID=A0AAW3ZQ80_9GAMM|nr:hypothetical protein [Pseudomarimonas arenosa]
MDKRLLDILCCPDTKQPVRLMNSAQLEALNAAQRQQGVKLADGSALEAPLKAGLITADGKTVYRIEDDIPVMLVDQAIATQQIASFPS